MKRALAFACHWLVDLLFSLMNRRHLGKVTVPMFWSLYDFCVRHELPEDW